MPKAGAGAATGAHTVALELALPAYHASQSLRLGNARVVRDRRPAATAVGVDGVRIAVGIVMLRRLAAVGRRPLRGTPHGWLNGG